MPVFPERESALLSRLHRKGEKAQDKRTWVIGGKEENTAREAERFKAFRRGTGDSGGILSGSPAPASAAPSPAPETSSTPQRHASAGTETMMGVASSGPSEDILSSLADLELTGNHAQNQPLLSSAPTGAYSQELAGLHIQPTGAGGAPLSGGQVNGSNGINGSNGDAKGLVYHATLGGVNPALLAPLTVADGVEKVSQFHNTRREKRKLNV